ncbi:MAG: hypothetical protein WAX44_01430 [Minisyncoccia bacterium]
MGIDGYTANIPDQEPEVDEISKYEKDHNVDQDTLAKSYLAHCDVYHSLSEKAQELSDTFLISKD